MRHCRSRHRAFTLIEVLLVIGIVVTLATIMVVAMWPAREEANLGTAQIKTGSLSRSERIAKYNDRDRARLLADAGIIRNKLKINAAITNAQAYLDIMDRSGSFSDFLWSFTEGKTFKGPLAKTWQDIPTTNSQSEAMSKALKAEGFKFVGSTICYAFMQAVGIIDDHLVDCFRFSGR